MVVYNLKKIQVVPSASDFIDILLSRTQRQTPTVVHKQYAISRIRSFYMRKVKFTSQTCHDKLTQILEDFPVLDEIHPFYGDLMNVLYDKDHYKLALGQINTARAVVDNIAKDYIRLLKYGDSLYRCKQLKRAALGRMCTLLKKLNGSLAYLERVRQHMARLPSIDPTTRTLLLCGYPNVGKSSFMNNVTRANVEVQPYAFTTKSLFVGHTDYKYLSWQLIDTPGILDHPLEDRNTIEMQSITALAHLRAAILFVVDISEQCSYTIRQQVALLESIRALFHQKPVILCLNKTDVVPFSALSEEDQKLLRDLSVSLHAPLQEMSTLTGDGVARVKEAACDLLLERRVEQKLGSNAAAGIAGRLHVATPTARDSVTRDVTVPVSFVMSKLKRAEEPAVQPLKLAPNEIIWTTVKDGEDRWKDFDPTVFGPDYRKEYLLDDDEWKFDAIPEIMDGKNVADYIDPLILEKLDQLEKEEEERMALLESSYAEKEDDDDFEPLKDTELLEYEIIQQKKFELQTKHNLKSTSSPQTVKTTSQFETRLSSMGIDTEKPMQKVRERSLSRKPRMRLSRSLSKGDDEMMEDENNQGLSRADRRSASRSRSTSRSLSRVRSHSVPRAPSAMGLRDQKHVKVAENKRRSAQKKTRKFAKKGEADRTIPTTRQKHLLSGKRGIGKTDRR